MMKIKMSRILKVQRGENVDVTCLRGTPLVYCLHR